MLSKNLHLIVGDQENHSTDDRHSEHYSDPGERVMRFSMPGNVGRLLFWMLCKPQILRTVRLRHQRTIFTTRQAVLDPRRIFVAGSADTIVEGATTTPTENSVLVGEPLTVLALLFL